MICRNCGREMEDGNKFCTGCGAELVPDDEKENATETVEEQDAEINEENLQEEEQNRLGKKKKLMIGAVIAAVVLVFGTVIAYCNFLSPDAKYEKYLELGQKYLLEENYEEAIIAFKKAIKIDPKRAEAYEKIADAYVALGDEEKALEYLKKGYENTKDKGLKKYIDKLTQQIKEKNEGTRTEDAQNESENLNAVARTEWELCDCDPGEQVGYIGTYHSREYNAKGDLLRFSHYGHDKELMYCEEYEYNEEGNCIKELYFTDENKILSNCFTNEYNAKGQCVKTNVYIEDGTLRDYCIYEYNAKGECIKRSWYDDDGELYGYFINKYNAKGECIEESEYDDDGNLFDKTTYEYNAKGECINESHYDADGKLSVKALHEYNEKGECIKSSYDNYYGENDYYYNYWIMEYNTKGQCIKSSCYLEGGILDRYWIKKYNEKGECIRQSLHYADGTMIEEGIFE